MFFCLFLLEADDVFNSPVLVGKEQRGSAWSSESKSGQFTYTQAGVGLAALIEEKYDRRTRFLFAVILRSVANSGTQNYDKAWQKHRE